MSRVPVSLTYGGGSLELQVPEAFLAGAVIRPRAMPVMGPEEILDRLRAALAHPEGRPRLRDLVGGRTVAVLVSDEFRAGLHEAIIRCLCEELAAGRPGPVTFICATGTHEPEVYTPRIQAHVAHHAAAAGLDWSFVAHSCDDPTLVHAGTSPLGTEVRVERAYLEAEVRVYGHESKHHYMNGYSLVDKQVVPGISARRTVEQNHKRSLSPDSGPGRNPWHPDPARQRNPFAEDARDVRHMVERLVLRPDGTVAAGTPVTFALDMISDAQSVYWVGAGDPDALCRRAAVEADQQAEFSVEKTPYLVISPGGPPASQAMYGVQNCFDMAMVGAVAQGGEVLVVAPCEGRPDLPEDVRGLATSAGSKALFWDNLVRLRDTPLDRCLQSIDQEFRLYMWKTWRVLRNFKADGLRIHVYSSLAPERLEAAGFIPVADPQAWIDERAARGDGLLRVVDQGNKLLVTGR